VPHRRTQIPHELPWNRTRDSAARNLGLTPEIRHTNILSRFISTYFLVTRNNFICRVSFLFLNFNNAFSFRSFKILISFISNILFSIFLHFYVVSFNLLFIFSSFVHCETFSVISRVLSLLPSFILPILHLLTSEKAY
jgi:hypothetical protein